jgi:hypothetical protein
MADVDTGALFQQAEDVNAAIKLNGPAVYLNQLQAISNQVAGALMQDFADGVSRRRILADQQMGLQLNDSRGDSPKSALTMTKELQTPTGLPSTAMALGAALAANQGFQGGGSYSQGVNAALETAIAQILQRGVPSSPQAGAVTP